MTTLPKTLDLSKFKRMLSILMTTYSECYIDAFGVVYGISQNEYTINLTRISGTEYEKLLPFIKDRYFPTVSTYGIVKDLKKTKCDARFGADGGILALTDSDNGENQIRLYETSDVPNLHIILDKYKESLPKDLYDMLNSGFPDIQAGDKENEYESLLLGIQAGCICHYNENGQILAFDKTMVPRAQYATSISPKMVYETESYIYWDIHIVYPGMTTDVITHTIKYN